MTVLSVALTVLPLTVKSIVNTGAGWEFTGGGVKGGLTKLIPPPTAAGCASKVGGVNAGRLKSIAVPNSAADPGSDAATTAKLPTPHTRDQVPYIFDFMLSLKK